MRQTVLIAEDEPKIAAVLAEYLQLRGRFDTHLLRRGDEVPAWVEAHRPDIESIYGVGYRFLS